MKKQILLYFAIITLIILFCFIILQKFVLKQDDKEINKTSNEVVQEETAKEETIKEEVKEAPAVLWGMLGNCKCDLNTFKYDKEKNEFSIDIYYDYDYMYSAQLISPFDKRPISKLIFATKFYPNENKMDITYKGHTSADFVIEKNNTIWYKNEKTYFDNNDMPQYIPNLQQYIDDFRAVISNVETRDYDLYKKAIVEKVYEAYKSDKLEQLKKEDFLPSYYVWRSYADAALKVYYDLKTYKYDSSKEEISIDVAYGFYDPDNAEIYMQQHSNKEPYSVYIDETMYLVFGTKYDLKNKKIYIFYKGFEALNLAEDVIYLFYDNNPKYIPNLDKYINECKRLLELESEDGFSWHRNNVTKLFLDAYKKGELYSLKDEGIFY